MLKKFLFTLLLIIPSLTASAGNVYSKLDVSIKSGEGKVYASTKADIDESKAQTSASQNTNKTSPNHTYYIKAVPQTGYAFKQWEGNGGTITDNPATVVVNATSEEEASPTVFSYQAVFEPSYLTIKSTSPDLCEITIDKPINSVGDKVKIGINYMTITKNSEFGNSQHQSNSIIFEGWYNESGELVSKEKEFEYTVSKIECLEARIHREFVIKTDASDNIYGYYRLATPHRVANAANPANNTNFFLCLTGNYKVDITGINVKRNLNGDIEFNQVNGDAYAKTEGPFADCGSIFYVSGKAKTSNLQATKSRTEVATNLVASAQGVSTKDLISQNLSLKTAVYPGYYVIAYSSVTLQLTYGKRVWVTKDHANDAGYEYTGDFDIQPVDLEHVDINYFGALPAEEMWFEGGYWTSMYTSFPYECYEPDGVEAYVVSEQIANGDETIVLLTQLKGGIVPAETPVLLKCKSTHVKENRLIPLMPDDSRIADAQAEVGDTNLLKGNYGLWTSSEYTGRPTYDDASMRVFSVSNGEVGFYRMDGTPELVPNRAYLDLTQLTNPAAKKIRLVNGENTGIEDIAADIDYTDPAEYYTIDGRRVTNPEHGRIYIVRQGSVTRKIRY